MSIGSLRGPKRTGSWLWTHKPWVLPRFAAMHTGWPSAQARQPQRQVSRAGLAQCSGLANPSTRCPRPRHYSPTKTETDYFLLNHPFNVKCIPVKRQPHHRPTFYFKKKSKNIRPKLLGLAATLNPRASSLFNLSIQIFIFFNL